MMGSGGSDDQPAHRVLTVQEHGEIDIDPSDLIDPTTGRLALSEEAKELDLLKVYSRNGQLVFQAGSYVGLVPLSDRLSVQILPRVPVSRLADVLAASGWTPKQLPGLLREYETQDVPIQTLTDIVAEAFLSSVRTILALGLHHEYRQETHDTSFPKGRILLGETVRRHLARGRSHVVAAARHEWAADSAPNRFIKRALLHLTAIYRRENRDRRRRYLALVNEIEPAFRSIQVRRSETFGAIPAIPDAYPHYRSALDLAALVLGNRSLAFDRAPGKLELASLFWKMDDVFESYLRRILQRGVPLREPSLRVLDGNLSSEGGGAKRDLYDPFRNRSSESEAKPDIVFVGDQIHEDSVPLIIDVKYKPLGSPERPDINQVVTYGVRYGATKVMIAHLARGSGPGGVKQMGFVGDIEVFGYGFQLASHDLEAEEEAFVDALLLLVA